MAKGKKKSIEQYDHVDKSRKNNPPVGLVTPDNDHDGESKMYEYAPHLDPTLQWAVGFEILYVYKGVIKKYRRIS